MLYLNFSMTMILKDSHIYRYLILHVPQKRLVYFHVGLFSVEHSPVTTVPDLALENLITYHALLKNMILYCYKNIG